MLLTIVSFIFVLGVVVFFHELGHFLTAKLFGVRVEKFSLGFPPKMVGFKRKETEYCISWIPLGGYVKMFGENPEEGARLGNVPGNFAAKPSWVKGLVFFAGPFANYLTAIILAAALFFFLGREVVDPTKVVVGMIEPGYPAEKAGVRPGDVLRTLNGHSIVALKDLQDLVFSQPDSTFKLVWEREGRLDSSWITAHPDTAIDIKGEPVVHGRIGIRQQTDTIAVGLLEAVNLGTRATWNMTVLMVSFVKKLITGEASRKLLGGPITIAKYSGEKAREGFGSLLDFIVIISINLAILNLLPIPVLDGGHLFILFVEFVRRRPLSLKQKAVVQQIGLAFLVLLIFFVTYNDIFVNWNR